MVTSSPPSALEVARHVAPAVIVKKSQAHLQVLDFLKQGNMQRALAALLQSPKDACGALPDLLTPLLREGRLTEATSALRASRPFAPLPHGAAISAMLALPQSATVVEGAAFVEALGGSLEWPTEEHESYFRQIASAIAIEFLDEAASAVAPLRSGGGGGGRPLIGVMLRPDGPRGGEYHCGEPRLEAIGGLIPSDALALSAVGAGGARPGETAWWCECEVAVCRPLIIRALHKDHPVLRLVGSGCSFRIDKLANRTGYTRMVGALHCLLEPPRSGGGAEERIPKRLAVANRPALAVRQALVDTKATSAKLNAVAKSVDGQELRRKWGMELNDSQARALAVALECPASLIQGPPGTGKTSTCVQILKLWCRTWRKQRKRACILATSDSNIAVDNLVEGLVRLEVRAVRVGHPDKAHPGLLGHTVDAKAARSMGLESLKECSDREQARRAVHQVIEEAEVVCCTSIGASAGFLQSFVFPRVLVDEAAQATEPATLVPICRGCEVMVLVGDQCQLPPTVTSDAAARAGLSRSLFERLLRGGLGPALLDVQYRMHPSISAFPRAHFYDGRISDGINAEARPILPGVQWPNQACPVRIVPVESMERVEGTSFTNAVEAATVASIVVDLIQAGLAADALGIIAPYAAQVRLIRQRLLGSGVPTGSERRGVEVSSVDGFQGREKDALLISTVRASPRGGLGFVADWRRANVALTRAKRGLVVVCHPATLARDPRTWRPWLRWAQERGCDGGTIPPALLQEASAPGSLDAAGGGGGLGPPPVGIVEIEQAAGSQDASFSAERRRQRPERSPSPEWRRSSEKLRAQVAAERQRLAAEALRGGAGAGAAAAAAIDPSADMLPQLRRPSPWAGGSREEEDDEEDDRMIAGEVGERRPRRLATGGAATAARLLSGLGYGGRQAAGGAAKESDPSPFVGGSKFSMSAAAAKLGVKALPTGIPQNKKKPPPSAPRRAAKKPCAPSAAACGGDGGGGALGLGAYASSSSGSGGEEEAGTDAEEGEAEDDDAGGGAEVGPPGAAGATGSVDEDEEEDEDDEEEDEDGSSDGSSEGGNDLLNELWQ